METYQRKGTFRKAFKLETSNPREFYGGGVWDMFSKITGSLRKKSLERVLGKSLRKGLGKGKSKVTEHRLRRHPKNVESVSQEG